MKKLSHNKNIEKFYSFKKNDNSFHNADFLSFGYWTEKTKNYHKATKNLLDVLLKKEKELNSGIILNIACGYGFETFIIYNKLKPHKIYAIDIVPDFITYGKELAIIKKLNEKIIFQKKDAVNISFKSDSIQYVIGIEGSVHFNSREKFLRNVHRFLESNGVLLLTDIAFDKTKSNKSKIIKFLSIITAQCWHVPSENFINIREYRLLLEQIGYKVDVIKKISKNIFPGFAKYNTKTSSIIDTIKKKGIFFSFALIILSWLTYIMYKHKIIDYIYIRAVKK